MALASDTEIKYAELAMGREQLTGLNSLNEAMLHCLELAQIAAKSSVPVMITGEGGTGKSLLAVAIHYTSPRRALPCLSLNCTAVEEKDFKRLLFGQPQEPGILERAGGGTVILDTVDLLPSFVQRELLATMTRWGKEANRVGVGVVVTPRLITTSSGELAQKAATGMFIQELMYCLGEITIRLPALRDRPEDLNALTARAIKLANKVNGKEVTGLSRTASDFIRHYSFPGNIRELFLIINRAVRDLNRDTIYVEDLGLRMDPVEEDAHLHPDQTILPLFEMEKRHINKALLRTGWKKRAAARLLGISETMLKRKIALYGLEKGRRTAWLDRL